MMLPGVRIKTSQAEPHPVRSLRMQQFNGATWRLLAE
jgi:hypothetical protein